jgi:hypothetical protein
MRKLLHPRRSAITGCGSKLPAATLETDTTADECGKPEKYLRVRTGRDLSVLLNIISSSLQ